MQLTLDVAVTRVRRLRRALVFETKGLCEAYEARHGRLHRLPDGGLLELRPRQVDGAWVLCSWHSGHPWLLEKSGKLARYRSADVL